MHSLITGNAPYQQNVCYFGTQQDVERSERIASERTSERGSAHAIIGNSKTEIVEKLQFVSLVLELNRC